MNRLESFDFEKDGEFGSGGLRGGRFLEGLKEGGLTGMECRRFGLGERRRGGGEGLRRLLGGGRRWSLGGCGLNWRRWC